MLKQTIGIFSPPQRSYRLALWLLCSWALFPLDTLAWPRRMGDLDGDGRATVVDLMMLVGHLNKTAPLPPALVPFADVNQDGVVDEKDVQALMDAIMGKTVLPALKDSDGDGIPDLIELAMGYNPFKADSDNDGINDGLKDPDNDGLTNAQEIAYGTNPFVWDTDGDGWSDEAEITAGSDPLNPNSRPKLFFVSGPAVRAVLPATLLDPTGKKLSTTLAQPRVAVVLPSALSLGATPIGLTLAQPRVAAVLPSALNPSGLPNGMTLAQPRVTSVLPSSADISLGLLGMALAEPPVLVVLPGSGVTNGPLTGLTLAQPPLKLRADAP